MLKRHFKRVLAVAMLTSIATFAYADDAAPVYDADSYPPAFDGQMDASAPPVVSQADDMSPPGQQPLGLDQRMAKVERQINNMQSKDISGKVESLQSEIQSLRGQVETLTHQLQQAQTQQRTMYSDLDKRMSAASKAKPRAVTPDETMLANDDEAAALASKPMMQTAMATSSTTKPSKSKSKAKVLPQAQSVVSATASGAPAPAKAADQQPNVAEEQQIYQTAYDLIKAKKYNEAINALQKMLRKYPTGQFAANAHYWLGELYGLLEKKDQSALEFAAVVKNYPDSPKVSDAQLKLGLILAGQFKWADAKFAFKKVINHYPGTASARLAAEQLRQIKEAGH
ncbi:MAG: tol-pal system protein YbgF [Gammaproteobacteria bacterium]